MALTNYGFNAVAGGLANTKGSYIEVVASTPYASSRLYLTLSSTSAARIFFLLDIAVGAASSEVVKVSDIPIQCDSDFIIGGFLPINVDIPAGSRITIRCQSPTASASFGERLILEDRALGSITAPVTYGVGTSTSNGTLVDPGTTINTKGSYVQITSSTTAAIDVLIICVTASSTGSKTAFTSWNLDIATGASSSETVIIGDLLLSASTGCDLSRPLFFNLPITIPISTRLAVRASCSRNTAIERELRVSLIGMQEPVIVAASSNERTQLSVSLG